MRDQETGDAVPDASDAIWLGTTFHWGEVVEVCDELEAIILLFGNLDAAMDGLGYDIDCPARQLSQQVKVQMVRGLQCSHRASVGGQNGIRPRENIPRREM